MFKDPISFKKSSTLFFSATTVGYTTILILVLLLSDAYLYAGSTTFLPVYLFLIVAELIKYIYIKVFYNTHNHKPGLKPMKILFNVVKNIKLLQVIRDTLVLASSTCCVYFFAVLFGAQGISKCEETLMFSCLMIILTMLPVILHENVNTYIDILYNNLDGRVDSFGLNFLRTCMWTFLGAWVGAFVIPLDWNRKWQAWPIPCSLGAFIGYDIAHIITMFLEYRSSSKASTTKLKRNFR